MAAAILTAERLREALHYDAATGIFTWRSRASNRCRSNGRAGSKDKAHGYIQIRIDGHLYTAHRLAWLYVHGTWPREFIDHINGIRIDNRINNLREADASLNGENQRRANSRSKSGLLGVTSNGKHGWSATIHVRGSRFYLGLFDTPQQAHRAYLEAKRKYHEGCSI